MSIENSNAIKIGLVGYGNLSKTILQASQNHKDSVIWAYYVLNLYDWGAFLYLRS